MSQREAGGQKARNKKEEPGNGKREEAVIAQGPAKSRSCGERGHGGRVKIFVMRDAEQDKPGSSRNQRPAHKLLKPRPKRLRASRALSSRFVARPYSSGCCERRKVFADGLGR